MVGDRGMITQRQVDALQDFEGIDWITALRPAPIRKLLNEGALQMGLFDERNLFELTHSDFPNERLVACRNHELAKRRALKRQELLEATSKELKRICRMVERGRLHGREDINARVQKLLAEYKVGKYYKFETRDDGFDFKVDETTMAVDAAHIAKDNSVLADKQLARWKQHMKTIARRMEQLRQRIEHGQLHGKATIGVRVGKVLNKYKVGKHFKLDIRDDAFSFEIDKKKVEAEAALDGIYVIRTSLSAQQMNTEDTVRSYKLLTQVERAFRSFKTMDLKVRPISHRLENRVRAHIFLCMLAYYVEWHMLEAWRPVLFSISHRLENRVRAHIFLCMLAYYVEWHMLEAWRPVLFSTKIRMPRQAATLWSKGPSTSSKQSRCSQNRAPFPLPNLLKQSRKQPSRGQELQFNRSEIDAVVDFWLYGSR